MLIYNLYAIYDKSGKTVGAPFIAVNDEIARQRAYRTLDKMKETIPELEKNNFTVFNLGIYRVDIVANYDNSGNVISYDNNIVCNDDIYDINNLSVGRRPRHSELEEMSKKEIENIRNIYCEIAKGEINE